MMTRLAFWLAPRTARLVTVAFVSLASILNGCAPATSALRELPDDTACERRLERLWQLMWRYRSEHGSWPRNFVGPGGNEHSWRVLLVPYAVAPSDPTSVLSRIDYRLDQPWNSQRNIAAIRSISLGPEFVCYGESKWSRYPFTSYLMLVRPVRADRTPHFLPPDAVAVVESAYCEIGIAEPKDIQWETLWEGDSPFGKGKLNSPHPLAVKALRFDGKVIDIAKDIGKDDLRRLLNGSNDRKS